MIARPFAVGRYAVTFDEWDACVAAGGCSHKPEDEGWGRGRRPVINVGWEDAQAYVAGWRTRPANLPAALRSRMGVRCPWWRATGHPWGDEPGTNRANFRESGSQWSGKQTAPVGSFEPNAFGLYDMIGNVWEWVQDCWNEQLSGAPRRAACGTRRLRPAGGARRLLVRQPEGARVASRNRIEPGAGAPSWVSVSPGRSDLLDL